MQAKTSLLYTFQRSMQANRNIIYGRKNHPFTGYPAVKHPKHSKLAITNIREKPGNFFYCSTRALTLVVSAIILLIEVPLQKFPFLFIFIIPWSKYLNYRSCGILLPTMKYHNSHKHSQRSLTKQRNITSTYLSIPYL